MAGHGTRFAFSPQTRAQITAFTDDVFASLTRSDQRRWAFAYLEGLLTTSGRKSIRRLAETVSPSPTASESLGQFINASPWEWAPVRDELTRWTEQRTTPRAWTIGTAVMPKRGELSCGVHRRFVQEAGRMVTCQVGIGIFLSSGRTDVPVDWRLLLPDQWVRDGRRRRRARIPDSENDRSVWEHTLGLLDALGERTALAPVPVVADASSCQEASSLIRGLSRRGRDFVVAVPGSLTVRPGGHAPPARHGQEGATMTARDCFTSSSRSDAATVSGHNGQPRLARVLTGLVRLPGGARQTYRLFTEWKPAGRPAGPVWITSLVDQRMDELLSLADLQSSVRSTVQTMESDFGLLDFRGRSYPGWHHHMTLVSAAFAYDRLADSAPRMRHPASHLRSA